MDYNDLLKAKKRCVEKLANLQKDENLTPEKFEEIEREMDDLDQRLAIADRLRDANEDLKTRGNNFTPEIHDRKAREIRFEGVPAIDRSYRGMFGDYETDTDGIDRFRASMVSGTLSAGGYAVPDPLAAKWLDTSLPDEIVRPRATVWPMTSKSRSVPGWDAADMSTGTYFGGFGMEFLGETEEGTNQRGKMRKVTLHAWKGAIFCDASNELLDDGMGVGAQIETAIRKSISLGMDHYFLRGAGANQPLGILEDSALVSVAKETDQADDSIVYENVTKMYSRHYNPQRAVWLCNSTSIPQLAAMVIPVGTGGSHIKLLNESNGKFHILGRPVLFSPSMPILGDANDIVLADLSQYAIGLRKDIRMERSNIPQWTSDQMSYRAIVRFDGQGTWNTYITPRNGDTLSWVVGLAERA
ncbi:phage major capsid protein, HK97 family [Desulfosarcina variabilis str. Montpellier]